MMKYRMDDVDIAVIGGGHAGCEAALASARMGMRTALFAINLDSIAMMPCNPNIGGSSKGHLVREIDALGGEMGKNIDKTFIQSRMLNTGKGPAVYSLRAQADKVKYSHEMKRILENTENLTIRQMEIVDILTEDGRVTGVVGESGAVFPCRAAIICAGTYAKARCLFGETIIQSGPNGFRPSHALSDSLKALGVALLRFKTGTPARVDKRSLDFSKMIPQPGDEKIVPFSFETNPESIMREQVNCYLTYTNEKTHHIIRDNLHRSPLYAGVIEGTGTRYCPSIEDKVVRFSDKNRHQLFLEPEGEDTNEWYVSGLSTSLPEDVQLSLYRTVAGMENCVFMRTGYAIEYDCIDATQLNLTLEFKNISGLYSAGQFNGSSGYEEAAAQGLMAGTNAALKLQGRDSLVLDRSEAYIGVLIDDLVTKGSKEPYRMMTSRAEYRLLLRQDNADFRLTPKGYKIGLIFQDRYDKLLRKKNMVEKEIKRVDSVIISPGKAVNDFLESRSSAAIASGIRLSELMKRPELDYWSLKALEPERESLPETVEEQVNIQIKYEGYIRRQVQQVRQFKKMEEKKIPEGFDYESFQGIRLEAKQKLSSIRPANLGQASRITGVSPADISVLMIALGRD